MNPTAVACIYVNLFTPGTKQRTSQASKHAPVEWDCSYSYCLFVLLHMHHGLHHAMSSSLLKLLACRSHVTLNDSRALGRGSLVGFLRVVGELKRRPPVANGEVVLRHRVTMTFL